MNAIQPIGNGQTKSSASTVCVNVHNYGLKLETQHFARAISFEKLNKATVLSIKPWMFHLAWILRKRKKTVKTPSWNPLHRANEAALQESPWKLLKLDDVATPGAALPRSRRFNQFWAIPTVGYPHTPIPIDGWNQPITTHNKGGLNNLTMFAVSMSRCLKTTVNLHILFLETLTYISAANSPAQIQGWNLGLEDQLITLPPPYCWVLPTRFARPPCARVTAAAKRAASWSGSRWFSRWNSLNWHMPRVIWWKHLHVGPFWPFHIQTYNNPSLGVKSPNIISSNPLQSVTSFDPNHVQTQMFVNLGGYAPKNPRLCWLEDRICSVGQIMCHDLSLHQCWKAVQFNKEKSIELFEVSSTVLSSNTHLTII